MHAAAGKGMVFDFSGQNNVQLNYTDMKKVLFAFSLLFGVAVAANAQDSTSTSTQDQTQTDQYRQDDMNHDQDDNKDKKEISVSQLPPAVSAQLQTQDYTGWTVSKAWKKEKAGEDVIYGVELKNGEEIKKVKFDAQGNVLKEKEKKDRDQK
jgi:hypothetical protein